MKSRRILANVLQYTRIWKHKTDQKLRKKCNSECWVCNSERDTQSKKDGSLLDLVDNAIFRHETARLRKTMPKDKLTRFIMMDGIMYYSGRIDREHQFTIQDLDTEVFFDAFEFSGLIPVVQSTSEVFFSYLMYVHTKLRPHAGVEITLKEVNKKMYIPDSPRKMIKSVRNDCIRCKLISKKTLELEMGKYPKAKTVISPPFYHCQMDVVYGFTAQPYKRSKTTYKVYALVIVCILTSATSILVMDGIQVQDVVSAIERHSARYGVPAEVFVDNGSQLKALSQTSFSIRNLDAYLMDKLGMRVTVSNPKAHEEQGKVENKVKQVRAMLKKTQSLVDFPMPVIQWETTFAKVASMLDDLPFCKGNNSNVSDLGFDVITPNRLKLGRNNSRSLEGNIIFTTNALPSDILDRNRKITSAYYQVMIDRVHHLISRPNKWCTTSQNPPKVNDTVLFVTKDGNISAGGKEWKLGRVIKVTDSKVSIMYPTKTMTKTIPTWKFVDRNWREVSVLMSEKDLPINSTDYYLDKTASDVTKPPVRIGENEKNTTGE